MASQDVANQGAERSGGAGARERCWLDPNRRASGGQIGRPDFTPFQAAIADLACDWAFVLRLEGDAPPQLIWLGGGAAARAPSELPGFDLRFWLGRIAPADLAVAIAHYERADRRGVDRAEFRLDLPGKGERWVESALRVIEESELDDPSRRDPSRASRDPRASGPSDPESTRAEATGVRHVCGMLRDVSERRTTELALRESEGRFRALVEQASDGILVFDGTGRIETCNRAACDLFDLSQAALCSSRIQELFTPDDQEHDPRALARLAAGSTLRSVRRLRRQRTGSPVSVELSARLLDDGRVQATVRDISDRIEAEERIRDLAYFDSLTSLPNREFFREQMNAALERGRRSEKPLALLFLDVDRFKQVNDSLGHSVGDDLLRQIADRLRSAVRGTDSVSRARRATASPEAGAISRLGGDEFTILIEDLEHAQDAARVARRVLHAVSRPFEIGDREIFSGASIGIAVWPEDGIGSEELLRSADIAMYHAKNRGGNAYEFFSASMNVASNRRLEVETQLRRALERDEFGLVYQPIRDTRTGRVSAVEALVRWVNAEGERVGPDEFIPIAEETGLIVDIGAWVLRTACAQSVAWENAGFEPVRLSVNISVEQLRDLAVTQSIDQILFETGMRAANLELEITESSILDENPNIIRAVGELMSLGIGFALDDFGTGYSSLSALQRFPIERLKIDRTFVAGVGDNKSDEALASAIVALAKRLDLKVVAEGVESEIHARFLAELGCDELQGYLFGRPVPPEEFASFLRPSRKREVARPVGAR